MRLSVEILDHIFSFLVHDYSTLTPCIESDDPILSPIAERWLYSNITVCIGDDTMIQSTGSGTSFNADRLFQFLSEKPRVKNHVRTLLVINMPPFDEAIRTFAEILVLLPNLDYISINTAGRRCPEVFRASLKGPINLLFVKIIQFFGQQAEFPFWLLDRCENLRSLFLMGTFEEADQAPCDATTPAQLKSLVLRTSLQSYSLNWIKPRITKLVSLTIWSHVDPKAFPALLGACSATLKLLDINLTGSKRYSKYHFQTQRKHLVQPFPVFSLLPCNLQRLTIRTGVETISEGNSPDLDPEFYMSWFPAAAELIRRFIPLRPRHLVLDITFEQIPDLANIDIFPLAILEAASVSIPRIDLYASTLQSIRSQGPPSIPITEAGLMSALEKYTKLAKLINEGKISIHVGKTAPYTPGF